MGEQVVIPLNFLPFEISPPQISHISKYRSLCLIQDSKTGLVISQRGSSSFHLSLVPLTGILNPKYIFMFTFYRMIQHPLAETKNASSGKSREFFNLSFTASRRIDTIRSPRSSVAIVCCPNSSTYIVILKLSLIQPTGLSRNVVGSV